VPFHELSNGALATVERGWFREAVLEKVAARGKKFFIQCTTWRDKKQVTFLHTSAVGASSGHFVARRTKGRKEQSILKAPKVQKWYSKFFNAVDRNDRDSSDYTTSQRTNRWYLRVFFWILDRVCHQLYQSAVWCARNFNIGPDQWMKYSKKNGRYIFQVDLGMALINYAIGKAWPDTEGPRPTWIRQTEFLPCDCGQCFFCLNGVTSAVVHKHKLEEAKATVLVAKDRSTRKIKGHTQQRVDLQIGSSYCRQCLKIIRGTARGKEMTSSEAKKQCYTSRLGCPACEEQICGNGKCWEKGYWPHIGMEFK
jgi:hypothetical protein